MQTGVGKESAIRVAARFIAGCLALLVVFGWDWGRSYHRLSVDRWEPLILAFLMLVAALVPPRLMTYPSMRASTILLIATAIATFIWWVVTKGFGAEVETIAIRVLLYGFVVYLLFPALTQRVKGGEDYKRR